MKYCVRDHSARNAAWKTGRGNASRRSRALRIRGPTPSLSVQEAGMRHERAGIRSTYDLAVDRRPSLPRCYPQSDRNLADRGCRGHPSQLWINLWKLWIAPFSCVVGHVRSGAVACWSTRRLCYDPGAPQTVGCDLLGWSGDSGVLPVRHAVECARTPAQLVPSLPRRPHGAVGRRAAR